jgi:hypothetical protein
VNVAEVEVDGVAGPEVIVTLGGVRSADVTVTLVVDDQLEVAPFAAFRRRPR